MYRIGKYEIGGNIYEWNTPISTDGFILFKDYNTVAVMRFKKRN